MSSSLPMLSRTGRRVVAAAAIALAASVMTLVLGWTGGGRQSSAPVVRLGWPLAWVTQDQSALSPPAGAPAPRGLLSPWEHPTRVHGGHLVLDVVVGACSLGVAHVVGVGAVLARRRRRPLAP